MLQPEIAPYAQSHRDELEVIIEHLTLRPFQGALTLPRETVEDIVKKLRTAQRGFYRFEAATEGLWKDRERYRDQARDCRINHK